LQSLKVLLLLIQALEGLERQVRTSPSALTVSNFADFIEDHLNREEMISVPCWLDGSID
jgi:hypothetical protein